MVRFSSLLDLTPCDFSLATSFVEQLLAFGVHIMGCVTSTCFCIVYSLFLPVLQIKAHFPHVLSLMEIYPFLKADRTLILRTVWEVCQNCAIMESLFSQFVGGFLTGRGEEKGEESPFRGQCSEHISLCRQLSGQELKCFHYS